MMQSGADFPMEPNIVKRSTKLYVSYKGINLLINYKWW